MRCILAVDDDPSIRRLLVAYLSSRGFRLLEASNGREALASMRAADPDLVVMDLMMPVMSGMEVLRERLADPWLLCIPMIVVTASNKQKVIADVRDAQVWAVFAKPFDLTALSTLVTSCLEAHPTPRPLAA
jgi:CheY-like chemotaxis protein